MQARIKRDDLNAFRLSAKAIEKSDALPVLSFVRITVIGDTVSMTKSNLKSFIVHTAESDSEDCDFLVDENILFNFLEICDKEFVNFKIEGIRITIYDERSTTKSPTEKAALFPFVNLEQGTWVSIPKPALDAIGSASQVVLEAEIPSRMTSVYVGNKSVAGCDGAIAFLKDFDFEVPTIVLTKPVSNAVSRLASCEYSFNESYNLFRTGNTVLGFSKSEIGYIDLHQPLGKPEDDKKANFCLNKNLLIKWNKYCVNSCKSKVLVASWKADMFQLNLQLIDSAYEFDTSSYIDVQEASGEFSFDPEAMNKILSCLPDDQIYFYQSGDGNRYFLTNNDRTFLGVIMKKLAS